MKTHQTADASPANSSSPEQRAAVPSLLPSHPNKVAASGLQAIQILKEQVSRLPSSVKAADDLDLEGACWLFEPRPHPSGHEEETFRETIEPVLERFCGWGKSVEEVAGSIRRGENGIDGFCSWMEAAVESCGIPLQQLQSYIDKVQAALQSL